MRDQQNLPKGNATNEQFLTEVRALTTSFVYGGSRSGSCTFGSIDTTIVNPRLDVMGGF